MSREIKFRALRENERGSVANIYGNGENNKKWVYGSGIVPVYENTCLTDEVEMVVYVNYGELDYWQPSYYTCRIKRDSICQFTGLYDCTKWDELTKEEQKNFLNGINLNERRKNTKEDWKGREIYEGDIIDGFVVTYVGDTGASLGMSCGWYSQRDDFESWVELRCIEEYKVQGNIYENPELIQR